MIEYANPQGQIELPSQQRRERVIPLTGLEGLSYIQPEQ